MLKLVHGNKNDPRLEPWEEAETSVRETVTISQAAWPAPFRPGLEYNSPAHGPWNIVHIGMLVPESHQIYVCGGNCNRGVVLTAAEMDAGDRYSFLSLTEGDLYGQDMEGLVIDGVTEIIGRLTKVGKRPRLLFLFLVCVHHFMGTDIPYIYRVLRDRFPDICLVESYMDPIVQKGGITPDEKLRAGLYEGLVITDKSGRDRTAVNIVGNDFPTPRESQLVTLINRAGCQVRDLTSCRTWEDYQKMGDSFLNISIYPLARSGAGKLSDKMGVNHLHLPVVFDYDKIDQELLQLARALDTEPYSQDELAGFRARCETMLEETRDLLGGMPLALDVSLTPGILGLTRLLLDHGFKVKHLYGDAFAPEEEEDFLWLKDHAPWLPVTSMIHHNMRTYPRFDEERVLALGQKAAYFHQTPYFVNMVEGGGFHGYDGICRLLALMQEACREKKDTRDLVGRKGLGCPSCLC